MGKKRDDKKGKNSSACGPHLAGRYIAPLRILGKAYKEDSKKEKKTSLT